MKRDNLILWAGLALLLFGGGTVVYTMTRGLRNNNPGNIRRSSTPWVGLAADQTDASFLQFATPAYGIRAMYKILLNYANRGLTTVQDIISTWAPPTENDTQSYIDDVAGSLNVDPGTTLDLNDQNTLIALTQAIVSHENGINPYSQDTFVQAYGLI